jgi:hypothetical protein
VLGIVTELKRLQPLKVLLLMDVMELGSTTVVSLLQLSNADTPMLATELPMVKEPILEQL